MRCLTLLSLIALTSAQMWIPKKEQGFVYKSRSSDVQIKLEAFLDLLCPDSMDLYQPLLDMVDTFESTDVQLRVYAYPLPYHTYSFYAAKGAFVFESLSEKDAYTWFSGVYNNMNNFGNDTTFNETTETIIGRFANLGQSLGADRDKFYNKLASSSELREDTVLAWKYGASRGVHSTPTTFINGVQYQGESGNQMTYTEELKKKLKSLLSD